MLYSKTEWKDLSATAILSSCEPGRGAAEHHAVIVLNDQQAKAAEQYGNLQTAIGRLQQLPGLQGSAPVFKRFFVSDAANQQAFLTGSDDGAAVSIVQQPPLNGTKVAAWVYFVEGAAPVRRPSGSVVLERPACEHLYNTQMHVALNSGYAETHHIFDSYADALRQHRATLKDHCIRTWIFVQGVDIHYAEMVRARKEVFDRAGLTADTHYIASTGIEGRHPNPQTLVQMDAYAVNGIRREQVEYLHAPDYLNPTCEYGVTFERGTAVDYGDRRHVFISGTASINSRGEIVHPGDIEKQMERTMENLTALLSEAGTAAGDIAQMTVYLRDMADYGLVSRYFERHHAGIPRVTVLAPVCRPGWLIEVECMAIKAIDDNRFAAF
jgi:enamine deaminase RidA (YjgF/YER057c/UK114 family)